MGKSADNDSNDTSSHCFRKISLLSVAAIVVPSAIFLHFGFSPFLVTVSILSLSTIFLLTVSKRKPGFAKNRPENHQVEKKVNPETDGAVTLSNAPQQSEATDFHDYQVESTDCPSASESSDDLSASEGFELNWDCFNNLGKNVSVSEMLASSSDEDDEDDDENLIEISFPDNSSSPEEAEDKMQMDFGANEKTRAKMQMELPQYLPESMFTHEGFMELLKEINEATEEENLIEIDLSMGSIKSQ